MKFSAPKLIVKNTPPKVFGAIHHFGPILQKCSVQNCFRNIGNIVKINKLSANAPLNFVNIEARHFDLSLESCSDAYLHEVYPPPIEHYFYIRHCVIQCFLQSHKDFAFFSSLLLQESKCCYTWQKTRYIISIWASNLCSFSRDYIKISARTTCWKSTRQYETYKPFILSLNLIKYFIFPS